jgi:hypothetical protein
MFKLLKRLFRSTRPASPARARRPRASAPRLEQLECRDVPSAVTPVATVNNVQGNAEVVAVTTDGGIWEQTEGAYGSGYSLSNWYRIGGGAQSVAAVRDMNGNAEIFALCSGNLYVQKEGANASGYNPWSWSLIRSGVTAIATGNDRNGRAEIFAACSDGKIYEQTEPYNYDASTRTNYPLGFGAPNSYGDPWSAIGYGGTSLAVGKSIHGDAEVFATTSNGTIWEQTEGPVGYSIGNWSAIGYGATSIAAGKNYYGTAEIFAVTGSGGTIYEQTEGANASGYSTGRWSTIGYGAKAIATTQDYFGHAEIYAVTSDGNIWEQTEGEPASYYGTYSNNAGTTGYSTGNWSVIGYGATAIAAGREYWGHAEIFSVSADGSLWERTEDSSWGKIGQSVA